MNITKKDIDSLNAVVTVDIKKEDYSDKVSAILTNYRKTANVPGFRKGHVPMGMVQKQYGKAVLVEEVNKLLQESLNTFLTEEKLDVLGNPLPKNEAEINWETEDFSFEFELGLSPQFNVDVKAKSVTNYKIVADDKMLENQVKTIRKQYGKLTSKTVVEKEDEITGTFSATEKDLSKKATFSTDVIKGKKQLSTIIGAKVGDVLTLQTKGMFNNDHDNQKYLGVADDEAHGLDIEVSFKIDEVNTSVLADLYEELFDRLFGEGGVSS